MNSKKFRLDINNNNPFAIQLFEKTNETHILIRLTKGAFCDSLNLLKMENNQLAPVNLPAKALTLLPMQNHSQFSLNANFSSSKGFIDVEVYKGSCEEIVLAEVEFSFSESPYYISCNQEQTEFTIGAPGQSQITVSPSDDGGFNVIFILKGSPDKTIEHYFAEEADATQTIKRLYGRIKGRVKGAGFEERQATYKLEYDKNLNKTLSESFAL